MSVSKTERLRKLFADSYVLTSEEENKRLELLNQKYEDEKIKVAEKNQKIKEINDQRHQNIEKRHIVRMLLFKLYKTKWIE